MENRKYTIPDYETGQRIEVSKEQYQLWLDLMETFTPKFDIPSKPIILGTGGDIEGGEDLTKIFYQPENFNYVPNSNIWTEEARERYRSQHDSTDH